MKFLLTILILFQCGKIYRTQDCTRFTCINGFACISEAQRAQCTDNVPVFSTISTCLPGYACANGQCEPFPANQPTCSVCGVCISGQTVACISKTSYRTCLSGDIRECPPNMECYIDNPAGCSTGGGRQCFTVDEMTATTEAPTTSTTQSSTTESSSTESSSTEEVTMPSFDPDEFCRKKQKVGHFESPRVTDCTEYIFCYKQGHEWRGEIKKCKNGKLFDPARGSCKKSFKFVCRSIL